MNVIIVQSPYINQDIMELIRIFFPDDKIYLAEKKDINMGNIIIKTTVADLSYGKEIRTEIIVDGSIKSQSSTNLSELGKGIRRVKPPLSLGIKQTIYMALFKFTGNNLPWGILTGIRPMKILHELIRQDIDTENIINILTDEYKISKDKISTMLKIAEIQNKYIYPIDKKRYSLYISIPFCPSTCLYCSFPSLSISRYSDLIEDYVEKLIFEIKNIGDIMKGKELNTIYIGGGTPTAIPVKELNRIIEAVYRIQSNIKEFTVEAGRPDTIDEEMLKMLNNNQIDRLSINPQTMNDETLKLIGRRHKVKDVIQTYNMAREIGFKTINMDLIVGLPSEGLKEIEKTLIEIGQLNPDNLTVHTLAVKRGSRFKTTMDKYSVQGKKIIGNMLDMTREFTEELGLNPYYLYRQKQILGNFENIGYSHNKKECIYNIAIMEEKETIIGAGLGSVSKVFIPQEDRIDRVPNFKDLNEYINRIDEVILRKKRAISNF